MKKLICGILAVVMLLAVLPTVSMAGDYVIEDWELIGSWYGEYREPYFTNSTYQESYPAYMNLTIRECDENGNLSGEGYSMSISEGDDHEGSWLRFEIKGTVNFETGEIKISQTREISASNGSSVSYEIYEGIVSGDTMSGLVKNQKRIIPEDLPFSFGRVSEWAKDEITEANARGLIPETMKGKDLSQPVTRAEFAAISLELYEALSKQEKETVSSVPFFDIEGCDDEEAIKKAYDLNIVAGISATEFAPNISIIRQDLAAMLCRAIKKYKFEDWTLATDDEYYLDSEGVKKFADDTDISDYAKPSVYYLAKMGILHGVDDSHFAPRNTTSEQEAQGYATATREQAVALSLRIYKLSDMWE